MKSIGTVLFALCLLGAARPQSSQADAGNVSARIAILHSFGAFTNGANPQAPLVLGRDGNFYGTTANGGTNGGNGSVFRLTPEGALTSLYSFTGGEDGANPGALVWGADYSLYGSTSGGGTNGNGVIFRIKSGGGFTVLYSFTNGADGSGPASLTQGNDGDFYGATGGTIFKMTPTGALKTLASISGASALVQGRDGDFYGTAYNGGSYGTVFRITPGGVLTTLYSFGGGEDGWGPNGLVRGSNGDFYGSTVGGGINGFLGYGTVFKITPNGGFATLYSFPTNQSCGSSPGTVLTQGRDGNLYGTAAGGGGYYNGTFFRITPYGAFTTLYSFPANEGPRSALALGKDGNFYATALEPYPVVVEPAKTPTAASQSKSAPAAIKSNASAAGLNTTTNGTVFKISPQGKFANVYSFTALDDGGSPQSILKGSDGNFYGTTSNIVFKTTTNGGFAIFYSFQGEQDAINDLTIMQGSDGNFYGTEFLLYPSFLGTTWGDPFGEESVFKITPGGLFTNLYLFESLGSYVTDPLTQGTDGTFYGTATGCGFYGFIPPANLGSPSIFSITTNGSFTTLDWFQTGIGGIVPTSSPTQGRDGNLYGGSLGGGSNGYGAIFQLTTNGALTVVYSFTNGDDGAGPVAALAPGNDGNFYGSTPNGGSNGYGTIFKITTNGLLTSLYSFTNGDDGANPQSALVPGNDGNLYGFTSGGGADGYGAIFQITPGGAFTSLYSFPGGNGGANVNSLAQGNDGKFYGTTSGGGAGANGTLFRLSVQFPPMFTAQPPSRLNEAVGAALTLSATVEGMPPLTYQWQSDGTNLSDSANISGSASNALTISPLLLANSGNYRLIVGNAYGAITSAVTALTVSADNVSPTISISAPAPGARTTNGLITGDASDNAQVVAVNYWLTNDNNGVSGTAGQAVLGAGTTYRTWTIPAPTLPGSNTVLVQSVDFTGNKSPVRAGAFFYGAPSIFLLTHTGNGAVAGAASVRGGLPPANGAMLNIGEAYTLTAAPSNNWLFNDWTSGASVIGTNATLRFIMENGTAIQANFVTNHFTQMAGRTYNGLFYGVSNGAPAVVEQTAGMISGLTVNTKGIFSARLAVNWTNYALSGAFDATGRASASVPVSAEQGGALSVSLDASGLWDTNATVRDIQGQVAVVSYIYYPPQPVYPSNGPIPLIVAAPVPVIGWTNPLFLFASTTNSASAQFTMLLPPGTNQTGQPPGTGYVLITNHNGMLTCKGALADGGVISQTMPVNEDGFAPFYINLYSNTGLLTGWVNVAANAAAAANFNAAIPNGPALAWMQQPFVPVSPGWGLVVPDEFTRALVPSLSIWTNQPTLPLAGVQLDFTGGSLGTNSLIYTNLAISARNALTATNTGGLNLSGSYSPKTGLLELASVPLGGGASGGGAIALLQTTNALAGEGFFTNGANAGAAALQR